MLRTVIIIILIYLGYKFLTEFLLPIMRVSGQVKQQMRQFQEHMQEQQTSPPPPGSTRPSPDSRPTEKAGEYIDFEEVK